MLYRNNEFLTAFTMDRTDTLFFDEGLLPSKTYNYKAKLGGFTAAAEAVTMDTTSHDFTWQTFTFGGNGGSSYLKDVAIINENDIWAVGEMHTAETDQFDSNGVWVQPYNAVHWDGTSWELRRIYVNYRGEPNFAPLKGVFALPNGKIVFSSGLPYLPEGDHWKLYHLWDMGVLKNSDGSVYSIWGTSIDNLYFAGNKGTIVHYDGSPSGTGWKKIESGTSTDINDIWGIANKFTKQVEIYCAVSEFFEPKDKKILRISFNNKVDSIPWGPDRYVVTVWTATGFPIYAGGDGIFVNKRNEWKEVNLGVNYMSNQIRGYKLNDVFVVGHFGLFAHFNGSTWKVYKEVYNAIYGSLSVKNNLIVAVGERNGKGVITIGRRN
ncbi:MAG: hypothetical protein KJ799_08045, partial [Bacteroidetes bacterium]|nr:hypothetical protein [Bacteroidota bacterium]